MPSTRKVKSGGLLSGSRHCLVRAVSVDSLNVRIAEESEVCMGGGFWALDIKDMSWVEHTAEEVDFIEKVLALNSSERILDLACGFGRHSLELARRGYSVVGVDFTEAYVDDARRNAAKEGLAAEFILEDVLKLKFESEFDVVVNMADGAIGYFATEEENLQLFDVIARALKPGGKHLVGVCSAAYAIKHFPKRHWEAGSKRLSLADFRWNPKTSRMIYKGHLFKFGEPLPVFPDKFPDSGEELGTRLYSIEEIEQIMAGRGMKVVAAYGGYDCSTPASEDAFMQVVRSDKA